MAAPTANPVPLSGDGRIDFLVQGSEWMLDEDRVITYSLSLNSDGNPDGTWTAELIDAVERALSTWSAVADIVFVEADSGSDYKQSAADIAIGLRLNPALGMQGGALYPDPDLYTFSGYPNPEGDVFLDNYVTSHLDDGDNPFFVLVHEFGHALGLKHPHEPGERGRPTAVSLGLRSLDTIDNSVMSYGFNGSSGLTGGNPATPLLFDILAIQHIYGANTHHRAGDDTYVLSVDGAVRAIWDTGGSDTLDASTLPQGLEIDLNAGATMSYGTSAEKSRTAIAYDVQIENAIGTEFDDRIVGNDAANILEGRGGDDTLQGGLGADSYRYAPGDGVDTILDFDAVTGGADALVLGGGILPGDLRIFRQDDDLVIRFDGHAGDELRLTNAAAAFHRIEEVHFADGTVWSAATLADSAADTGHYPVLSTTSGTALVRGFRAESDHSIALAPLVSATDPDGDPVLGFEFRAAPSGGILVFNGANRPANQSVFVPGSDLASIRFRPGEYVRNESVQVRATDGIGWSEWTDIPIATIANPNQAPLISPEVASVGIAQSLSLASMFNATDPEGSALTRFFIFGDQPGGGYFTLNGVQQDAPFSVELDISQLGDFRYHGGGSPGTETYSIAVFDGAVWSQNTQLTITTTNSPNHAPAVAARTTRIRPNEALALSSMFAATDADGDAITHYLVRDETFLGSFLRLNGVDQAARTDVVVAAADLAQLVYVGGPEIGAGALSIRASDGIDFGAAMSWQVFNYEIAPVVMATNPVMRPGQSRALSTMLSVFDAEGDAITEYTFRDHGAGGGFLRLNGVAQAANTDVVVPAADLAQLEYVGGSSSGYEALSASASDGYLYGAPLNWQVAVNAAPVVTASNAFAKPGQARAVSSMFGVTDAEGDPVTVYTFRDHGAGGGFLRLNGVAQAANTDVVVAAADLAQLAYVGGAGNASETLSARASDGFDFGSTATWEVSTVPNRAPLASPINPTQVAGIGSAVAVSSLFSVNDLDGDAITHYRFWDGSAGGGQFRIGGVAQGANQNVAVSAAELANTIYAAGATQGSETLWVQAFDGIAWSPWASWDMQTRRTTNAGTPVISGPASRNSDVAQWHQLSAFLSVSDADGDRPVRFEITDSAGGAGTGLLYANGMNQAQGATVTVTASDLSGIWVQGGTGLGTNGFSIRAHDGIDWGAAKSFDLVTRLPNRAPAAIPTATTQGIAIGNTVAVSTLFSVNDPDGDVITHYRFWDGGAGGGQFRIGGVAQGANQNIGVSAADLANTVYAAGANPGSETLWVQTYDGSAWSPWASWDMQTQRSGNVLPVVSAPASKNADAGQWLKLSDFITIADADGDAMVRFEIRDGNAASGSGYLYANGMDQAQGATVTVNASSLATSWVRGGLNTGTDTIEIRAHDGFNWGQWASFDLVTRLPNVAPTATPAAATQGVGMNQTVAVSTLFSVTDANGDAMTQYRFWDAGAGGGQFRVNGVGQGSHRNIEVSAANLANTVYAGGTSQGSETLWVQAYDGLAWSPWVSWTMESRRTTNAGTPVINAPASKAAEQNAWYRLSEVVSVSDADGDVPVRFELRDANAASGSGYLWANGADLAQGGTVTVNASSLGTSWVRGGQNPGTDAIEIRAHDGFDWGQWASLDLVTRLPNRAPTVVPTGSTQGVPIGSSATVSTLFSVSDSDGDAMTQYKLWDGGAGGGQFRVNGVGQIANGEIVVSAANLANTVYAGGASPGTEVVYVQAYDGVAWSPWVNWTMELVDPDPGNPVSATRSSDFSASDFLQYNSSDFNVYQRNSHMRPVTLAIQKTFAGDHSQFQDFFFRTWNAMWDEYGGFPYPSYTLVVGDNLPYANGAEYGLGFESSFPLSNLQLYAHGIHHAWNGNAYIPTGTAGWFTEGLTQYYGFRHSDGTFDDEGLRFAFSRYSAVQAAGGDIPLSTITGSLNEVDPNQLRYWKGALVAYLLDTELAKTGHDIGEVARSLYDQFGASPRADGGSYNVFGSDLLSTINSVAGADFSQFYSSYIDGTAPLPFTSTSAFPFVTHT